MVEVESCKHGHRPSPTLRVLVVDDCVDVVKSYELLLRAWGHEVRAAYDAAAVRDEARIFRPHVILLDVALQKRADGLQVAQQIRADPLLEETVLICVTGFAMEADRLKCMEAGFDYYFAKPADPEEIQRLLAIEKNQLTEQVAAVSPG
jgi:CheY-like chemotaxis protein